MYEFVTQSSETDISQTLHLYYKPVTGRCIYYKNNPKEKKVISGYLKKHTEDIIQGAAQGVSIRRSLVVPAP